MRTVMTLALLLSLPPVALWAADAPHFPVLTVDDKWALALKSHFERIGALSVTLHLASGKTLEVKAYAVTGNGNVTGNALDGTAVLVRAGAIEAVTYKSDREAAPGEPAKP
jgi:hypothetical protein